jgi:hypothetical protein
MNFDMYMSGTTRIPAGINSIKNGNTICIGYLLSYEWILEWEKKYEMMKNYTSKESRIVCSTIALPLTSSSEMWINSFCITVPYIDEGVADRCASAYV